jgi:hypothetical protein
MADNLTSPVVSGTVLATDQIAGIHYPRTKISLGDDGSAQDLSANNPMPVLPAASAPVTVTGGAAVNAILLSVDTNGYNGLAYQTTGVFVGSIVAEGSNDNANWVSLQQLNVSNNTYTTLVSATAQANYVPAASRYIRLRVSTYVSGTLNAVASLRQLNLDPSLININGTVTTTGNVAAGTTDTGNPIKIGGVATSTVPTAVTVGQRVNAAYSLYGAAAVAGASITASDASSNGIVSLPDMAGVARNLSVASFVFNGTAWDRVRGDVNGTVIQSGVSSTFWNYAPPTGGIVNTTTAVTIKTAAAAGVRNYLKTLTLSHDALGGATEIAIRDGAAGTVLWRGRLQIPGVEDAVLTFDPPLKGTAATLMEVVTLIAVTGGVYVNATGWTGA